MSELRYTHVEYRNRLADFDLSQLKMAGCNRGHDLLCSNDDPGLVCKNGWEMQATAMWTSSAQAEGENRVLVVFGPSDDEKVSRQVALLETQAGELAERDMVVLQVSGNQALPIYDKARDVDAERLKNDASAAGGKFQVIPVGKDGASGCAARMSLAISRCSA